MTSVPSKTCRDCNETKELSCFYPRKGAKDGYRNNCRDCVKSAVASTYRANPGARREAHDAWYSLNAASINADRRAARAAMSPEARATESAEKAAYRVANRDRIIARQSAWRKANPDKVRDANARWYGENAEAARANARRRQRENPEVSRAQNASWYAANRERVAVDGVAYRAANKERIRAYHATYRAKNPGANADNLKRRADQMAATLNIAPTLEQLESKWAYWGNKCWMCGGVPTATDHVKPLSKSGPHILANFRPACKPCNSSKHAKWYGPRELHRFIR